MFVCNRLPSFAPASILPMFRLLSPSAGDVLSGRIFHKNPIKSIKIRNNEVLVDQNGALVDQNVVLVDQNVVLFHQYDVLAGLRMAMTVSSL